MNNEGSFAFTHTPRNSSHGDQATRLALAVHKVVIRSIKTKLFVYVCQSYVCVWFSKSVVDKVPTVGSGICQNENSDSRYSKLWLFPFRQPVAQQRQIEIPAARIVMTIHYYTGNKTPASELCLSELVNPYDATKFNLGNHIGLTLYIFSFMYLSKRPVCLIAYSLRTRNHNKFLILKASDLGDRHFIIRSLYKILYWCDTFVIHLSS